MWHPRRNACQGSGISAERKAGKLKGVVRFDPVIKILTEHGELVRVEARREIGFGVAARHGVGRAVASVHITDDLILDNVLGIALVRHFSYINGELGGVDVTWAAQS